MDHVAVFPGDLLEFHSAPRGRSCGLVVRAAPAAVLRAETDGPLRRDVRATVVLARHRLITVINDASNWHPNRWVEIIGDEPFLVWKG